LATACLPPLSSWREVSWKWIPKLLQVTDNKYLFVFFDEVGCLEDENRFHYRDLKIPISKGEPSDVYSLFLQFVAGLLEANYVACVLVGLSGSMIFRAQAGQQALRIAVNLLQMNPFPRDAVCYITHNSLYDETPVPQILFPNNPERWKVLSEIV
jgi:hypothetical protein